MRKLFGYRTLWEKLLDSSGQSRLIDDALYNNCCLAGVQKYVNEMCITYVIIFVSHTS
jgi:hypothetical protein